MTETDQVIINLTVSVVNASLSAIERKPHDLLRLAEMFANARDALKELKSYADKTAEPVKTNDEKRMMIVQTAHKLVEAEKDYAIQCEIGVVRNYVAVRAAVDQANEVFNAACDAVFGVAE